MYKKRTTLAGKMIRSFSLIFFLTLILVSVIILRYTNSHFKEQSYDYLKDLVQSHLDSLDSNFLGLQRYSLFIANNQDVQEAVYYRNHNDKIDYSIELYNQRNVEENLLQLKTMRNIDNAIIIGSNDKAIYSLKGDIKLDYDFSNDKWFNDFKRTEGKSASISYFTGFHEMNYLYKSQNVKTISMLTPIPNKIPYISFDHSYIMTDIDLSLTLLDTNQEHDVQIGIYDGMEWLLLPQLDKLDEQQNKELQLGINSNQNYFLIKSKDWKTPDLLVIINTSKTTGWKIIGIKNLQSLRDIESTILIFISILLVISSITISFASIGISKTILNPMNRLIEKFNKVAEGDYSVEFKESNSEEIARLSHTAQYMINNIVDLSNKVLQEQEKSAAVQMKVLQNQINPHFLNNVLQTIKGFAVTDDVENISKLTTLLGKILTYSTYQPFERVEIETELQHIENYIAIQNIRYKNKIFYSIYCEEELKKVKIPKLIIQPIVENAIEHGFINKKSGLLFVGVEEDDSQINIVITDDGDGMVEDVVNQLNENLQFKDSYSVQSSIGLLNVTQRIKKEFGEDYGVKVISRISNGTSVIITLPRY